MNVILDVESILEEDILYAEPETDDTNKNDDSSGIHLISDSVVRLPEYVTNVQLIPLYDIIILGVSSLEIETNIPNSAAQIILNHDPASAALPYVHVDKFVEYAIDSTPVDTSVATATNIPSSGELAAHLYALTVVDIGR